MTTSIIRRSAVQNGRYNIRDLERALVIPKRDHAIIQKWREKAHGKATIAFCCTHEHARCVAKSFNKSGVPAGVYISETTAEERRELLAGLRTVTYTCSAP